MFVCVCVSVCVLVGESMNPQGCACRHEKEMERTLIYVCVCDELGCCLLLFVGVAVWVGVAVCYKLLEIEKDR